MNSILKSWHEQGLHTVDTINAGDKAPAAAAAAVSNEMGDLEIAAIKRIMSQEGF